jgi:hypothetical protein
MKCAGRSGAGSALTTRCFPPQFFSRRPADTNPFVPSAVPSGQHRAGIRNRQGWRFSICSSQPFKPIRRRPCLPHRRCASRSSGRRRGGASAAVITSSVRPQTELPDSRMTLSRVASEAACPGRRNNCMSTEPITVHLQCLVNRDPLNKSSFTGSLESG